MTTKDTYFDLGKLFSTSGNVIKALEFYEFSFQNGGADTVLLEELASGYTKIGKFERAIYFRDQLSERYIKQGEKAENYFELGELYLRSGDPAKATNFFSLSVELNSVLAQRVSEVMPQETPFIKKLVGQESGVIEPSQNSSSVTTTSDKDSMRLTMMMTVGIMHYRNGDLEKSEDALSNTISDARRCENTWIEALAEHSLALVKTASGDIRGAIDAYLRAAQLAPNQISPWNKVGALYEDLDQLDEAFEAYYRSLAQNTEDPESWNGIGDLLTRCGKFDEAIACYQLGNVFDRNSYGTDGIKVYEKALEYYQQVINKHSGVNQKEDLEKTRASSLGRIPSKLGPKIPRINQKIEREPEGSLDQAEQPIPIPMSLGGQVSSTTPAVKMEEKQDETLEATIRRFELTVKENPFNDRGWDSLGNLYKRHGMIDKAIFAYENAVAIQPIKKIYHYQLGTLYAVDGNFQLAIAEMNKVLDQEPNSVYAHCALANYYRRLGKDQEASQHIETVAPYMKNEKEYDRACFESVRGNTDLAITFLQAAMDKNQVSLDVVENDLDLDFIRMDSQYQRLIHDVRKSAQVI